MQVFVMLALLASAPGAPVAQAAERDPARACLSAAETRAAVQERQLADPFVMLRNAARTGGAEPLRSRLCRWDDKFVYEMALLRRDGKVVRVYVNAVDGKPMPQTIGR